ncbi:hypothetical protein RND81_10G157200 [Saponaria officinalis]|uniref:Uncharacterized protein n=1 Tax=Saponaria officinalis TaxID=3572 RepID=A0AAW1I2V2_SAPOF
MEGGGDDSFERERKRKGKAKMGVNELEEEEEGGGDEEEEEGDEENEDEDEEQMLEKVKRSTLFQLISKVVDGEGTGKSFSWGEPAKHGISMWEPGECSKRKKRTRWSEVPSRPSNPLPSILNQTGEPYCIVYGIYHLLSTQAAIIARFRRTHHPLLSIEEMICIFEASKKKTAGDFLLLLMETGVRKKRDFEVKKALPRPGSKPFYHLRWDWGFPFTTVEETAPKLFWAVKHSGGVLLEYYANDDGEKVEVEEELFDLGHLVCCYGYRTLSNGDICLLCIDSDGATLEEVKLNHLIHHVYVILLSDWSTQI